MNNSVIDVAFIAAKVAAIKDEKARMIVGGAIAGDYVCCDSLTKRYRAI